MNDQEILKSFNSLNIMVFILLSILSVAVLKKNVTVHFLVKVPTVNKKHLFGNNFFCNYYDFLILIFNNSKKFYCACHTAEICLKAFSSNIQSKKKNKKNPEIQVRFTFPDLW